MKRLLAIMLFVVVIITMVGCAKLVKTEETTVEVTIVDSYHRAAWSQPMMAGKVMTVIHHPAQYRIDVVYNDVEYSISGSTTYHTYKDMVGETVSATLETRTFDDGTVKYDIISLG